MALGKIIIGVFCYKRALKLRRCIEALLKNPECKDMDIIFFSDGYKSAEDQAAVLETRAFILSITGFRQVLTHFREKNLSTGPNFSQGLRFLSEHYERFILVEDDLIVAPNYIKFLLDGLDYYKNASSVFCITGYVYPLKIKDYAYDSIIYKRFCSYGWAGWADRFKEVTWDPVVLQGMLDTPGFKKLLNAEGYDLVRMLKKQLTGRISTWDVQLQAHIAQSRLKVVYPRISKVNNIGFDEESTNTFGVDFLKTEIDDGRQRLFNFCPEAHIVPELEQQIKRPFGLQALVIRKLVNTYIKATRQVRKANQ